VHTTFSVLIAVAVCLVTLGAARDVPAAEGTPDSESAAADANDPVLAKVDGHPICQSDVKHLFEQLTAAGQLGGATPPDDVLIEELIKREAIRQFVLHSDVKVDPSVEDGHLERLKKAVEAQGLTFEQFLKQQFLTEEELKEILHIQVVLDQMAEAKITKEELAGLEEQVRASHILVKTDDKVSDEDAKKKILFVQSELEKGRDFAECAKMYSDCPSSANGGDLGFFPREGAMIEPFAAAAYALKTGEVSGPVKTQFGYHLIKVTDRSTEPSKQQLIQQKLQVMYREIFQSAKVERLYKPEPPTSETQEDETPKDEAPAPDAG
jgi:parvulin-like peptidyl-prolyl isomerase